MIVENSIVNEVKIYVKGILKNDLPEEMVYHSLNHTEEVVNSAMEIAKEQRVSKQEEDIIHIAAWFHDVGYAKGCTSHEKNGAEMAQSFLQSKGVNQLIINKVKGCIMATQMPQNPSNSLEKILCDADLMHLARSDYFKKADLLRDEIEHVKDQKISKSKWLQMNEEFLSNHCFFTEYAKKNYEPAVKENLKKVTEKLKSWKKKTK